MSNIRDLALECAAVEALDLRDLRADLEVHQELLHMALEQLHSATAEIHKQRVRIAELRAQLFRARRTAA